MTRKIYKSAMGKSVDMGSLLLQNEKVRAVGNMNVNARGDRLDSNNKVVEPKNQQVQRRYNKQTNVSAGPTQSSTNSVKAQVQQPMVDPTDSFSDLPMDEAPAEPAVDPEPEVVLAPVAAPEEATTPMANQEQPDTPSTAPAQGGGLAGAIARTREVKQELEKTRRQQAQAHGVRRI
jgi:hypothetical protein